MGGRRSSTCGWRSRTKFAEVQLYYDARSIESSNYNGPEGDFSDKYAIVGCYWPPHFAIMDGLTLEPFKIVTARAAIPTTLKSITRSHAWPPLSPRTSSRSGSSAYKETGQVWLVNYTDPNAPTIEDAGGEAVPPTMGLGLDAALLPRGRQSANKIAVIDRGKQMTAIVETSKIPHPGRRGHFD